MLALWLAVISTWVPSVPPVAQAPQAVTQEQWVNPGVFVPPTTSVSAFVKKIDSAIVGTLERISVAFLDESEPNTLHTVLTFRVGELLFGRWPDGTEALIDVLVRGGTFVEQKGTRVPKRPIEFARDLAIGAEYFVPIEDGDKFGRERKGQLMVGSAIAMSHLDGPSVKPVIRNMTWADEVVAKSRKPRTAAVPASSAREVLLAALREAGRRKP